MKRLLYLGLALGLAGCGQSQTTSTPGVTPVADPTLTGRIDIPTTFTNGTPFSQSTPFTNSTPYRVSALLASTEQLAATQSIQAIDPQTGVQLASSTTGPQGQFAIAVPHAIQTAILQVVVRDAQGRILGLLAMATHPQVPGARRVSPGSTVTPVAGAFSVQEDTTLTYGKGFVGVPRPKLARVLAKIAETSLETGAKTYDVQLTPAPTGNMVMASITSAAGHLAQQAASGSDGTPESIGQQLGSALAVSASPAPTPAPSPTPTPKVGRGPAIPAPYWPSRF